MELKYNPMSQQAEFELRGKFDPTGDSFDYALDSEMN